MKKFIKNLFIIVIISASIIYFINNKNIDLKKYNNLKENFENTTLNKDAFDFIEDNDIDINFYKWINKNFKVSKKLIKILKDKDYTKDIWKQVSGYSFNALKFLYETNTTDINNKNDITISFIGDVSLADNWYIMPKYDEREKGVNGILSNEVLDILKNSSYSIANNEFTISDRGNPLSGKAFTFRGSKTRLPIYNEMGIDLVTLANNHVYDFGSDAFNDMLDALDEYNIPHIGAGHNISEASKAYSIVLNGRKISFLNATRAEKNIMTPGATETDEGVFRCYDSSLLEQRIKEVKQTSDYVIVLVHYGKESFHDLEDEQVASSKRYIDAGADTIIGTHAHVLQGVEYYNGKLIAYNLGDFIFNEKTTDTGIITLTIDSNDNLSYVFTPCLESEMYTKVLIGEEKQRIINDMNSWSINACINSQGNISEGSC